MARKSLILVGFTFSFAVSLPVCTFAATGSEATKPLFTQPETFKVLDAAGKKPKFRVLDDNPSEQALAMAIASSLNMDENVKPKIPVTGFLDLEIQKVKFKPLKKNENQLEMVVQISGHEVEMEKTVSRSQLLGGDSIVINFPKGERSISMFSISGTGHLKIKFDSKKNELVIDDAYGKMAYATPLDGEGTETVRFKGRGVRQ